MELRWDRIAEEFPQPAGYITLLGEGWSCVAYRVGDLTFRFPKRERVWTDLDREVRFLGIARPTLPLPVPEVVHAARQSAGAPFGYVVTRFITGTPVDPAALRVTDHFRLPQLLGGFLKVLHGMDTAAFAFLPHEDERENVLEHQRAARSVIASQLSASVASRLERIIADHLGDEANFACEPRVLHADLSAEHILRHQGRISAILDWGDVSLGDPDYDFSYLYNDFGAAFVRAIAVDYGHPDVERLLRKCHYFAIADQIGTIAFGKDEALPGHVEAAWERLRELLSDSRSRAGAVP